MSWSSLYGLINCINDRNIGTTPHLPIPHQAINMSLLEKVQKHVSTCTQDQLDAALLAAEITEDQIAASPGLMGSIVGRLKKSAPGGLEVSRSPIASATSVPKIVIPAPVALTNPQPIDRDWAKFNPDELGNLSYEDMESYSVWQEKEEKRITLLNKIQAKRAATIASTEESLKNQLTIAETNRRVLQAKAQVEYATTQGKELDELAVSVGTESMVDQFNREKNALRDLATVGKETPTLGQVALLQATVIQRNRLNRSNAIANSIAPMVSRIEAAQPEKEVVTIDA